MFHWSHCTRISRFCIACSIIPIMEENIKDRLRRAVSENVFPGGVVGFIKDTKMTIIPYGTLNREKGNKVNQDTIYDVASITKSIPTSSLTLTLLDQKLISLDASVKKFIPEFVHKDVTVRHLLTQSIVLGYKNKPLQLSLLKDKTPEEIFSTINNSELLEKPGEAFQYSNSASILLGQVIESATTTPLNVFAEEIFFHPLGMKRTTFHTETFLDSEIAPTEIDEWRGGEVRGKVHDESAYAISKEKVVGSAGLFSTVPDLLIFLQMLLHEGEYDGNQYFSKKIIQEMYKNQLQSNIEFSGLGWELSQPQYMGKYVTKSMFGKTGFTGCVVIIDPEKKCAMVLLSNYTYPQRKANVLKLNEVRRDIADVVFGDAD